MAESIAREWHGPCLVALMGNGHIIHKFGVPERAHKRTGVSFRTVYLSAANGSAELSYGDYIWITPAEPPRKHARP